jgi:hypothetical protein
MHVLSIQAKASRPQSALLGGTALTLNADNHDTLAVDRTYTIAGTQANEDVTNLNLVVTGASRTVGVPPCRRVGSTGLISALVVPVGNHELSFKRIDGSLWLADSVGSTTETPYTPPTVATPTFSPVAGTYNATQSVAISCATSGATIHFTVDGSTPTTSSPVYSAAILVAASQTIKALAVKADHNDSAVASAAYVIDTVAPVRSGTPSVNGAGNVLTVPLSEAVQIGSGGDGGWAIDTTGAALTLAFSSISGSNVLLTPSRTILAAETLSNLRYTNPVAGVKDFANNDLASFTGQAVTNGSTQVSGEWIDRTPFAGTDSSDLVDNANYLVWMDAIALPAKTVTKFRAKIAAHSSNTNLKVALYNASDAKVAEVVIPITGTGIFEATLGTPVALSAGNYRFAYIAEHYQVIAIATKLGEGTFHYGNGSVPAYTTPSSLPATTGTDTKRNALGVYME